MTLLIITIIYLIALVVLGAYAYVRTKTAADYLVAGRRAHPVIMALSYGATFISTSAIVGFGGAAARLGMGLLWLTFCNIFVGIFIAFVFFGKRARCMGHNLNAHTFPELLGRRFNSKFIQFFAALIIFLFMPLYASAVLVGAGRFISVAFSDYKIDYNTAILIYTLIIALYVIAGGLKGVMWTDALQGLIMLVGMIVLLVDAYAGVGGVVAAHRELSQLPQTIEANAKTAVQNYNKVTGENLTLDDAVKLLAQATPINDKLKGKSDAERQAYLAANPKDDEVLKKIGALRKTSPGGIASHAAVTPSKGLGWRGWTRMPEFGATLWCFMVTTVILGVGIGVLAQPQLIVRFLTIKSGRELNRAVPTGGFFILMMTGVAFVVGALSNIYFLHNGGEISIVMAGGNPDEIIPTYVKAAMPPWFLAFFTLTLLSAAMSTQSSQFHTIGTSLGRDIFEQTLAGGEKRGATVLITRLAIMIGIIGTVVLALRLPPDIIVAATALFFGLCASTFLPMFFGALYTRGVTKAGAIAGMCTGFLVSMFWLGVVQMVNARFPAVLAPKFLAAGKPSLLEAPWRFLDALVIALPLAIVVTMVVSLLTRKMPEEHLDVCFKGMR